MDEPPSAELKRYLMSLHWTLPVYYDTRSEMLSAFSSFGTPAYYVIDGSQHIRFAGVSGEAELIAQVDALHEESRAHFVHSPTRSSAATAPRSR